MGEEKSCYTKVREAFTTRNKPGKILLAEFLGTFVLIVFGDGSVAQSVLSGGTSGEFISINIAWGLSVAMGVWISGTTSGGHINPAVTSAFCVMGKCPWKYLPIYWIGQYVGAIAGAAVVFGAYYQALSDFDGGIRFMNDNNTITPGIWATYPKEYLDMWGGFGDQIVGTGMLMMMIMAITDKNNMKPPNGMVPFCVGLIVLVIGLAFGHNCGYAINPARDLGPRIFTSMAGWGKEPFTFRDRLWFWVPFVVPHIGAIIGGWMYQIFVGNHIYPDEEEQRFKGEPIPDYSRDMSKQPVIYNKDIEMKGIPNSAYQTDQTPPGGNYNTRDYPGRIPNGNRSPYAEYGNQASVL